MVRLDSSSQKGISKLELTVVICIVCIILTAGLIYFESLMFETEKASFYQESGALKSAVSLTMLDHISSGEAHKQLQLLDTNPVLLLRTPLQRYKGAYDRISIAQLKNTEWAFDRRTKCLVYRARFNRQGDRTDSPQLHCLKIMPLYDDTNNNGTFEREQDRLEGIYLQWEK